MFAKTQVVFVALASLGAVAEVSSTVTGDYVEARSNHVYTCACLAGSEQSGGAGREAILAWSTQEGSFRGIPLAGVKVAAVMVGDDILTSEAAPRKSVLYLDGIASAEQQQALLELFGREYGRLLEEVLVVRRAPILFQRKGESVSVEISGTLQLAGRKARLPEDAHLGSEVQYEPFVPMAETALGNTVRRQYQGPDLESRWWESEPGITAYIGRFVLRIS
jgi:hypothetical protein